MLRGASLSTSRTSLLLALPFASLLFACSREEKQVDPGPPPPVKPEVEEKADPKLLQLVAGDHWLALRNSAHQVFLADSKKPDKLIQLDFSNLGPEQPSRIEDMAMGADDGVLAIAYRSDQGKGFVVLFDVGTHSTMRHFAAEYVDVALGDSGRLLLGVGEGAAEVRRVNDASLVKRREQPGLDGGAMAWESTDALLHHAIAGEQAGAFVRWEPLRDGHSSFGDSNCGVQLGLSHDGKRYLAVCGGQAVHIGGARGKPQELKLPLFAFARLSPDGKLLAIARSKQVEVAKADSQEQLTEFSATAPITGIAFTSDAARICVISDHLECRSLI
ncbi:MAG: hypothetical protein AB7K71_17280 [Polyangiaceae bacterium]